MTSTTRIERYAGLCLVYDATTPRTGTARACAGPATSPTPTAPCRPCMRRGPMACPSLVPPPPECTWSTIQYTSAPSNAWGSTRAGPAVGGRRRCGSPPSTTAPSTKFNSSVPGSAAQLRRDGPGQSREHQAHPTRTRDPPGQWLRAPHSRGRPSRDARGGRGGMSRSLVPLSRMLWRPAVPVTPEAAARWHTAVGPPAAAEASVRLGEAAAALERLPAAALRLAGVHARSMACRARHHRRHRRDWPRRRRGAPPGRRAGFGVAAAGREPSGWGGPIHTYPEA